MVTVNSGQPTSLPTQIPTTIEGITREQIAQTINATDSEDALKYFPSLLVRKRYIGDYNHAILSSRASGTGNSARSAVYADGILLSNYLGNGIANGTNYAPRWGLVTPEEIERVDVLYGPFSAAYPGNSVGAVVDYVTRMPTQFEAHAKLSGFTQDFKLYGTNSSFSGSQASASLGNRSGDWSWFINANRTESAGQPLTFATRTLSAAAPAAGATVVSGAVPGLNTRNVPWLLLGGATQYETRQEHLKLKVAYDFSSTVRASYTLGYWKNAAENRSQSYLRDVAGTPVYSGNVSINGRGYTLAASDFGVSNEALTHLMHGLSVKSNTQGVWDWEVAASLYDYQKDQVRAATTVQPGALNGGAGTLQDQGGTGWNTLAFKGIWRPEGIKGAHIVDFGFQQDSYTLRILKSAAANWLNSGPGAVVSDVGGKTRLRSVYAQDAWAFAPQVENRAGRAPRELDGLRRLHQLRRGQPGQHRLCGAQRERGLAQGGAVLPVVGRHHTQGLRRPRRALSHGGRAVRRDGQRQFAVHQRPEFAAREILDHRADGRKRPGQRLAAPDFFTENTRDALYSQTTFDPVANSNISRVQNVGRIKTQGVEVAFSGNDVLKKGLDLSGSVTYADSRIKDNSGFVAVAGDTLGKYQPRVPVWRATALASYRFDAAWTATVGARYSGKQYSSLDNSDVQWFCLPGHQQILHDRRARALPGRQAMERGRRHRQPEQLPVLEFPPLSAAHPDGRTQFQPLGSFHLLYSAHQDSS